LHPPLAPGPQEYEQRPPHRALATLEPLLSGAAAVGALLLPAALPGLAGLRGALAAAWLALVLWAALAGCPSPVAWLLGVFLVDDTPQALPAAPWRALACASIDTAFVAATVGLGALPNAAFRWRGGQSVAERLLGVAPAVEEARELRLGPAPSPVAGGSTPASARGVRRAAAVTPRRL
jgi:hypothetical protein